MHRGSIIFRLLCKSKAGRDVLKLSSGLTPGSTQKSSKEAHCFWKPGFKLKARLVILKSLKDIGLVLSQKEDSILIGTKKSPKFFETGKDPFVSSFRFRTIFPETIKCFGVFVSSKSSTTSTLEKLIFSLRSPPLSQIHHLWLLIVSYDCFWQRCLGRYKLNLGWTLWR